MRKYRVTRHEVVQPSDPSYRLIVLDKLQNAVVDTADFEWLNQWNWFARWNPHTQSFYALRTDNDKGITIYMHRLILGCHSREQGDHIDHDTLNNRRKNLRKATHAQNCWNTDKPSTNTSGYKGITWQNRAWYARISVNGTRINLGAFPTPELAAEAYKKAERIHHRAFAKLPF